MHKCIHIHALCKYDCNMLQGTAAAGLLRARQRQAPCGLGRGRFAANVLLFVASAIYVVIIVVFAYFGRFAANVHLCRRATTHNDTIRYATLRYDNILYDTTPYHSIS